MHEIVVKGIYEKIHQCQKHKFDVAVDIVGIIHELFAEEALGLPDMAGYINELDDINSSIVNSLTNLRKLVCRITGEDTIR